MNIVEADGIRGDADLLEFVRDGFGNGRLFAGHAVHGEKTQQVFFGSQHVERNGFVTHVCISWSGR